MATIIMSMGVPGSGKTAVLRKIFEWDSFEYIAPDDIRLEKWGNENDHSDDKAIWVVARSRVADAIKRGKNILFDSTFSTIKRRAHFMEFARANGIAVIEGLYFDIPLETVLTRNLERGTTGGKVASSDYIREAHAELQSSPPRPEEGFDVLLRIDQNSNVTVIKSRPDSILSTYFAQ